jgi:hypothetical protein
MASGVEALLSTYSKGLDRGAQAGPATVRRDAAAAGELHLADLQGLGVASSVVSGVDVRYEHACTSLILVIRPARRRPTLSQQEKGTLQMWKASVWPPAASTPRYEHVRTQPHVLDANAPNSPAA